MTNNVSGIKRKKILFMITKGNFGGAQRYVFDLATNLPKDKYESVVALGGGETLEEKLNAASVRTIKMPFSQRNVNIFKDIWAFFTVIRILKIEKTDILHLNSSKMGLLGAIAGRLTGVKKIIFTGHGWAFKEERNIISKIFFALLHWLTILLSHKTIAVSLKTKDQIKIFPFTKNKIICIHNGTATINFLDKNVARNKLISGKENLLWLGTISELHKNKGLDFAIEAFSRVAGEFKNTIFVIIGEGEEKKNLEKKINELNQEERVFLVGFKTDANQYLKAFDIGVLTSRQENLPYTLLEMGLAELPIIASWVGGIPEVIVNSESGILVQKGSVEEIENAMRELIKNEEKRKELGKNLRERVSEKFTLQDMIKKVINLYETI